MDTIKFIIENAVYPVMEKMRGNHIRDYLAELRESEKKTGEELSIQSRDKLCALLLHCAENVPAYKDVIDPDRCRRDPMEALRGIPPLTKKRFMEAPERYLNKKAKKESLIPNLTGGSTSEPVRFYIDRKTVEYYEAARWRGLSWYGISPGSRSVMVWGSPIELSRAQDKRHTLEEKYLKNRIVIPAYALKPENVSDYCKTIERYKPEYIYGYSSALHALSTMMKKQGIRPGIALKAVVSTSETLHDFQREIIKEMFCCPVVNEYGARDGGILAYECADGNLHVTCENAVLEIVDPITYEPKKNGETGLLLVTDLNNFSMPRLRYALGDMAALSDETCSCGRGMRILKELSGRVDDMFRASDGRLIHGHAFNHIARNLTAITKFQIRQKSPENAVLRYVVNENAPEEEVTAFLNGVSDILSGSEIEMIRVADIEPEKSGKFRYAIREFEL